MADVSPPGQTKMPLYCERFGETFQESSQEERIKDHIPQDAVSYLVEDADVLRPPRCHRCGAAGRMVIHQYRTRGSVDLLGDVTMILAVRFKCACCKTTITVLPQIVHCCKLYNADAVFACLWKRVQTGRALCGLQQGVPVRPTWSLQQRWYKDFRDLIGEVNPSRERMVHELSHQRRQTLALQKNYQRMEDYPPFQRNPSIHHALRIAMPLHGS